MVGLVLGGREVTYLTVESAVAVPVDPLGGGELDLSLFFFFRPRTVSRTESLTWGFAGRGGGLRLIMCSDQGARDGDEGREGESAA